MVNETTIEAYKAMAKDSECPSMETQIRENLERTCDKFAGNEDKFERSLSYLEECASEILEGKNGDVPDEVCFRICRDYFNDEIWKKEDEAEERARRTEEEKKAKKKAKKSKPRKAKPEEEKASKCARCGIEVLELEKGLCPACHALLHPAQEPEEEKPAFEPEAESIPEQKPAFKPVQGQISFLDMLGA